MTTNDSEVRLQGYTLHVTADVNISWNRQKKAYEHSRDYTALLAYFCLNYLRATERHQINFWNLDSAVIESSTSYNLWMVRYKPDPNLSSNSPVAYGKTGIPKCDNLPTKLDMRVAVKKALRRKACKFPCTWKCGHTTKSYEIPSFPGACTKVRIRAVPVNWASGPVLEGPQARQPCEKRF
jgi:hypothetical protein